MHQLHGFWNSDLVTDTPLLWLLFKEIKASVADAANVASVADAANVASFADAVNVASVTDAANVANVAEP